MSKEQFISAISELQEPLRRFLLTLCGGDAFSAYDIAQDACIRAWIALDRFRGAARFSTWLFRIAYNCWCNRKYDSHTIGLDEDNACSVHDADGSDTQFEYQGLYQAISQLTPREKAAILLFYMEDRDIKEIASIMDAPSGTIKSLLSRGRAKLKLKLQ